MSAPQPGVAAGQDGGQEKVRTYILLYSSHMQACVRQVTFVKLILSQEERLHWPHICIIIVTMQLNG